MTEARERAEATRKANKAARERREAERKAAKEKDRPVIVEALRAVLAAPEATARERLLAAILLDDMQRYDLFNSYRVRELTSKLETVEDTTT